MFTAARVAKQEKLDRGFRVVVNDGIDGCKNMDGFEYDSGCGALTVSVLPSQTFFNRSIGLSFTSTCYRRQDAEVAARLGPNNTETEEWTKGE